MNGKTPKVLLIGFGNPARGDDGLGPAFADLFEDRGAPCLTVDSDYQLTVEDAAAAAEHDIVVFADADAACGEAWHFAPVAPGAVSSFSSHGVEPPEVVALAHGLFDSKVRGFILGIRGYDFSMFRESLTDDARTNLKAAEAFFRGWLNQRGLQETADRDGPAGPAAC